MAELVKFNPHHDERGRFATADGARAGGKAPKVGHEVQPKRVRVAGALSELLGRVVPPPIGGNRRRQREENQNPSLTDPPPPSFPSSPPDDPKDKPPPAAADTPREPAAAAGAPAPNPDDPQPDDDKKAMDGSEKPTVRLSDEYKNIVLDEHPGLTREALAKIEEEAQPPGTTPDKPAGKGVTGPDVTYRYVESGEAAGTVQVKVANSVKAVPRLIAKDLDSQEPSEIIAVQAPEGTSSGAVRGAIRDFPFDSQQAAGKLIVVVDAAGRILIRLSPL